MLETELKKLTAAVEALTAAMTAAPVPAPAPAPAEASSPAPKPAPAPVEDAPSTIPLPKRQKEAGERAFMLIKDNDAHREAIKGKLDAMGARKITALDSDQLDEMDSFLGGLEG